MGGTRTIAIAAVAAAFLFTGRADAADDPGVIQVDIIVGQDATVSGGPIREFLCDDGNLVKLEFIENGVAMKGLRAGTTLCSFRDIASVRRVVRVVVRDPPAAPAATPPQPGSGK
jgi:hypothetical protein